MTGAKEESGMGSYTPDPLTNFTDADRWAALPEESKKVKVTPAMARNWLDTRAHPDVVNIRNYSKATGQEYGRLIALKKFPSTHQGIAFVGEERDSDGDLVPRTGVLLDGRHRLEALCIARDLVRGAWAVKNPDEDQLAMRKAWPNPDEVHLEMWVHPNEPADTFAYVDLGRKRDARQLYRGKHGTILAGAARWLVPGHEAEYARKMLPAEVLDLIGKWHELEKYAPLARSAGRQGIPAAQHLAIIAMAARTRNKPEIDEWFEGILTGENLKAGDPRLKVRDRFAKMDKGDRGNRELVFYNLVKGWNAWAAGERMQVLSWRFTEGPITVRGYGE